MCARAHEDVQAYVCEAIEACLFSSSIILHHIFLRQDPSLKLELVILARLSDSGNPFVCSSSAGILNVCQLLGPGVLNSSLHDYAVNTTH